jgi:hypothetical protein
VSADAGNCWGPASGFIGQIWTKTFRSKDFSLVCHRGKARRRSTNGAHVAKARLLRNCAIEYLAGLAANELEAERDGALAETA